MYNILTDMLCRYVFVYTQNLKSKHEVGSRFAKKQTRTVNFVMSCKICSIFVDNLKAIKCTTF